MNLPMGTRRDYPHRSARRDMPMCKFETDLKVAKTDVAPTGRKLTEANRRFADYSHDTNEPSPRDLAVVESCHDGAHRTSFP